mmetsp:Transcript_1976/g.4135  ORF Transcript_1976/g.4135 Transcript_1976/m.4135 type:complete len:107 (-) Transcript_1976:258-578(-)
MLGAPVYAAAKAGVIALTKALSSLPGLKAIAICPDFVDTSFVDDIRGTVVDEGSLLSAGYVVKSALRAMDEPSGSIIRITLSRGAEVVQQKVVAQKQLIPPLKSRL